VKKIVIYKIREMMNLGKGGVSVIDFAVLSASFLDRYLVVASAKALTIGEVV